MQRRHENQSTVTETLCRHRHLWRDLDLWVQSVVEDFLDVDFFRVGTGGLTTVTEILGWKVSTCTFVLPTTVV